ncbi:MAG: cyclic-phosphate processing receiver domain-containing protein [Prochloraceae cyanobacterium]
MNHLLSWIEPIKSLHVLIIEDTEERQNILTSLYRSHGYILLKTGKRAIMLLDLYDFDIISIDYNLPGQINGETIAKHLSISRNKNARIIIHSMNPKGAEKIAKILPDAILYPVLKIVKSNRNFKFIRSKIDSLGTSFDWQI